jgi:hypothetical protein
MKNKFYIRFAVVAITVASMCNVTFCFRTDDMIDFSLANIEALANEEGGNAKDCPGGYCSMSTSLGDSCEACCPSGKNPQCSMYECSCKEY